MIVLTSGGINNRSVYSCFRIFGKIIVSEKLVMSRFSFEFSYEYKINESVVIFALLVSLLYYLFIPSFSIVSIS